MPKAMKVYGDQSDCDLCIKHGDDHGYRKCSIIIAFEGNYALAFKCIIHLF